MGAARVLDARFAHVQKVSSRSLACKKLIEDFRSKQIELGRPVIGESPPVLLPLTQHRRIHGKVVYDRAFVQG